jgi:endoglucanase
LQVELFAINHFSKLILCCVAAGLLNGCGNSSSSTTSSQTAVTGKVTVSGTTILRDGVRWIPHGMYEIAFEAPTAYLKYETNPFWATAQNSYTPAECTDMVHFGADSVRIQVAQTGMDPQATYFTKQYRDNAVAAIKAARSAGLSVVISVQDEPQTGRRTRSACRAQRRNASGSILHQFSVPTVASSSNCTTSRSSHAENRMCSCVQEQIPSASDWTQWATSMNTTIATIRRLGAVNVVIADGLELAEELSGAPALMDPLQQVIYGVHPYAHNANDQKQAAWDTKFGNFAKAAPVMVSEWGVGYFCNNSTGPSSVAFLQYLQDLGIGLQAGTWDWAPAGFGSVIEDFPKARPVLLRCLRRLSFQCKRRHHGGDTDREHSCRLGIRRACHLWC